MEYLLDHVTQKDVGKRLQVGQEVIELILNEEKSPDLEQDQSMMDRMVDAVASSWVNSSNYKVKFELDSCFEHTVTEELLLKLARLSQLLCCSCLLVHLLENTL